MSRFIVGDVSYQRPKFPRSWPAPIKTDDAAIPHVAACDPYTFGGKRRFKGDSKVSQMSDARRSKMLNSQANRRENRKPNN